MANVRPIICVIGEYHSSRIRRIKFVWIRGEYSPRKFQMNSTVFTFHAVAASIQLYLIVIISVIILIHVTMDMSLDKKKSSFSPKLL